MSLSIRITLLSIVLSFVIAFQAKAVTPGEKLQDPQLEAKAREITKELRCLVCQNQSIDDSDAGLAKELRVVVRERVLAGDSKSEVIDVVTGIYGEYVLLRPRWGIHTFALWISPVLLLLVGVFLSRGLFGSKGSSEAEPLSGDDNKPALKDQHIETLNKLRE